MNRLLSAFVALALSVVATEQCQGAVTNHRLYHLGEADAPPAVALAPGDDPTFDSGTDSAHASKIGLTFYEGLGLVSGSTFGMEFTNVDSRYVAPAALLGVIENFGMEAYIQVSAGVTEARAFYNGGGGTPFEVLTREYGLGVHSGRYSAIVAGTIFPTPVAAVPGVPVEMALVNPGGTQFDVYIQRTLVLSFLVAAVTPPSATDLLSMGNFVGNQSPPAFAGVLDEARVFTFVPGGFDPPTDLGAAAVVSFAGTPGQANCHGKSVSALAK